MRSLDSTSSLAVAVLLSAACRGDPATAPPVAPAGTAPASAVGPVAVTEVLDLGTPAEGGGYAGLQAVAVNERGQVAVIGARSPVSTVPLLWEAGAYRPLADPAGGVPLNAVIAALNDAGVGAGSVLGGPGVGGLRAALFAGGAPVLLPDGPGEVLQSRALGINDAGDVVGVRVLRSAPGAPTSASRATLWRHGTGEVVDLGALAPGGASEALAVNNRGQAVGSSTPLPGALPRPVFFANGRVVDLGVPPGYLAGVATAVNERGQAAGYVFSLGGPGTPERAVLWDHGRAVVLDVPAGAPSSRAAGINDAGDVVGSVVVSSGPSAPPPGRDAALWRGGALTVLPRLPGTPAGSVMFAEAADVNNRGQVVGLSTGAGGARRAVRWTVSPAAPEPEEPPGPNRAPAVVDLRPEPAQGPYRVSAPACGGRYTACVRFTVADPDGEADAPFRVTVDWGDGAPWTPNELTRAGVPALAPHSYTAPGAYTVRVTATDRRGATSTATLSLAVSP